MIILISFFSYKYKTETELQFPPSLHEFIFSSVLMRWRKIGSHRLPIHRRGAHRKFFDDPFLF